MKKWLQKKLNRSGTAKCAICNNVAILVRHHINGRQIANAEAAANIASICPNCHQAVHEGKLVIEGWAMTFDGARLFWHRAGEESITGQDSKPYIYPTGS